MELLRSISEDISIDKMGQNFQYFPFKIDAKNMKQYRYQSRKKAYKNTILKLIISLSEPKMSMYLAEAELLDNSSLSCDYDGPQALLPSDSIH